MIPNAIPCILVSFLVLLLFANACFAEPVPGSAGGSPAPPPPLNGQVQTIESPADRETDASMQEDEKESRAWVQKLPPLLRPDFAKADTNRAPLMAFRRWAHERKPFFPTFLFCLFVGLVGVSFFPTSISNAEEACKKSFWRCLGRAFLVGTVLVISVRILNQLQITLPLSTVLLAVLQMGILAGLSVGISLIGDRLIIKTGFAKLPFMAEHPRLVTFMQILIGSLMIALIAQIPGIGRLPRIGIRIALLIAILGVGGLLKARQRSQIVSNTDS